LPKDKREAGRKRAQAPGWVAFAVTLVAFLAILSLGVYVRLQPALRNDFELQGDDSWEVYWVTNYLVEHGISSWFRLDRSNPDTHIFWYPWGQDFKHADYPLIHMFNAATYPIARALGLSVKQWVAVTPALFGGLMVASGFLLARRLAGDIPALLSAAFLAFAPGALERTVSTFAEKQGLGISLLLLALYFTDRALEKKSLVEAAVAGALLGLLGWSWGGYQAIYLILGVVFVVAPVFHRYTLKEGLAVFSVTALSALIAVLNTTVPLADLYRGASGVLLASGLMTLLASALYDGKIKAGFAAPERARLIYAGLLVAAAIAGLVLTLNGYLAVSGRALSFLTGRETSPLGASVAEHQPQSLSEAARKTGVALVLSIVYVPIGLIYGRKRPLHLFLSLSVVIGIVVMLNAAYLTQLSSSLLAVGAGLSLWPLASRSLSRDGRLRLGNNYALALIAVAALSLLAFAPTLKLGVAYAASLTPSPKTGMVGISVENRAWYYALDYIRDQLPEGSVVIAWWDYGYIISAYTGKATVADGMTNNGTQIELLARALTAADENETLKIVFEDFKAPRDRTYLLIFDIFQSVKLGENQTSWYTGPLINPYTGTQGMGDIPKSIWMLRIAGRLGLHEASPYFAVRQIRYATGQVVPIIGPDWGNENVSSVMIYRLFISGVQSLNETSSGPIDLSGEHYFVDPIDFYTGVPAPVTVAPPEHIKPLRVFVDPVYDSPTNKVYVAVFLFKVG